MAATIDKRSLAFEIEQSLEVIEGQLKTRFITAALETFKTCMDSVLEIYGGDSKEY